MSLKTILACALAVYAFLPQEAPKPQTRSVAGEVDARTPHADFMGTVHVSSGDLFGGGWFHSSGNPTFTLVLCNDDPKQTLDSVEGFVGFAPGEKNRVIEARAKSMRQTSPDTWETAGPNVAFAGQSVVDERGVLSFSELALAPGGRVQLFVDSARRSDLPISFGFKVKYR